MTTMKSVRRGDRRLKERQCPKPEILRLRIPKTSHHTLKPRRIPVGQQAPGHALNHADMLKQSERRVSTRCGGLSGSVAVGDRARVFENDCPSVSGGRSRNWTMVMWGGGSRHVTCSLIGLCEMDSGTSAPKLVGVAKRCAGRTFSDGAAICKWMT